MRLIVAVICCVALAGCAQIQNALPDEAASYEVYVMDVTNPPQLIADNGKCVTIAQAYPRSLSVRKIASSAAASVANNAGAAAFNVIFVAAQAAGGATTEILKDTGLNSDDEIKVLVRCMDKKSLDDHAFKVIDPKL